MQKSFETRGIEIGVTFIGVNDLTSFINNWTTDGVIL